MGNLQLSVAADARAWSVAEKLERAGQLRAVLCGTFRRDLEGLAAARAELLNAKCQVLSPGSVDFVSEVDGFVFGPEEVGLPVAEIEAGHLDAMRKADFVWLHSPDGYVGTSAALEIGFAHGLGIPVFAATKPADVTLGSFVTVVKGPRVAIDSVSAGAMSAPGRPLRALQLYYALAASRRGYDNESAQDTMLLLTEEIGELARAIRKYLGLRRDTSYSALELGEEIADVQLYLVHLANVTGTDLAVSVTGKERINRARLRKS